jgi:hypothetical protein
VAQPLADRIVAELAGGCDRVEVAGSVRRRAATVGDIEVLALPLWRANLLGEPGDETLLDPILRRLVDRGSLRPPTRNGPRWKTFELKAWSGIRLDLFIIDDPAAWGMNLAIRTGPENFSRRLVTHGCNGGLLPNNLVHRDGFKLFRILPRGDVPPGCRYDHALDRPLQRIPTREESDVFAAYGIDPIPPKERR